MNDVADDLTAPGGNEVFKFSQAFFDFDKLVGFKADAYDDGSLFGGTRIGQFYLLLVSLRFEGSYYYCINNVVHGASSLQDVGGLFDSHKEGS